MKPLATAASTTIGHTMYAKIIFHSRFLTMETNNMMAVCPSFIRILCFLSLVFLTMNQFSLTLRHKGKRMNITANEYQTQ